MSGTTNEGVLLVEGRCAACGMGPFATAKEAAWHPCRGDDFRQFSHCDRCGHAGGWHSKYGESPCEYPGCDCNWLGVLA